MTARKTKISPRIIHQIKSNVGSTTHAKQRVERFVNDAFNVKASMQARRQLVDQTQAFIASQQFLARLGEFGFHLFATADIANRCQQMRFSVYLDHIERDFGIKRRAVIAQMPPFKKLRRSPKRGIDFFQGLILRQTAVRLILRRITVRCFVYDLRAGAAEHLQRRLIAVDETVCLHQKDAVACTLEQRPVTSPFFLQGAAIPDALGDVRRNAQESIDATALSPQSGN